MLAGSRDRLKRSSDPGFYRAHLWAAAAAAAAAASSQQTTPAGPCTLPLPGLPPTCLPIPSLNLSPLTTLPNLPTLQNLPSLPNMPGLSSLNTLNTLSPLPALSGLVPLPAFGAFSPLPLVSLYNASTASRSPIEQRVTNLSDFCTVHY